MEFKTGLYHFLKENLEVEAIPTWIENLNRVLPKGTLLPIPLICTVTFGRPVLIKKRESKKAFLQRSRQSLLDVAALHDRGEG